MNQLRCKPGDLAVIISSRFAPENIGRLVIVDRIAREEDFVRNGITGAVWIVCAASGGKMLQPYGIGKIVRPADVLFVADNNLRPIRPNDGKDESLSWSKPIQREDLV